MSYMIIKRITITPDQRVMVCMAANNIRPLNFRYDEIESLTETLRTKGRPTLDLELLSLFFYRTWQGHNRYSRAVAYMLLTDHLDSYEAWERCREDKAYEHTLLLRMRGFLHYRPVPCRCHLEYQRCPGAAYFRRTHLFIVAEAPHLPECSRSPSHAGQQGLESRQFPHRRRRHEYP